MNKFAFGSYDGTNTDSAFLDASYTDPTSEAQTRKMFSYPLKELKDYINTIVNIDTNDKVVQLKLDYVNSTLQYSLDGTNWADVDFYGAQGEPGEGVPTGGTAGQYLKKSSATDYDTEWADVDSVLDPTSTDPVNGVAVSGAIESRVANKVDKSGTQTFHIDGTTFQLTDSNENTVEFTVEVV